MNPLPQPSATLHIGRKCANDNNGKNSKGKKKEMIEDSPSDFKEDRFPCPYFVENPFTYKNQSCTTQKETLYLLKYVPSYP